MRTAAVRIGPATPAGALAPGGPVKRPPRLLALTDRLAYRTRLHAHRQARAAGHRQALLAALGHDEPDPRAVKRAFRRLAGAGRGAVPWHPQPPVVPEDERPAQHEQLRRLHRGIGCVLDGLPERSRTARYLRLLRVQITQQWLRVESVVAYEHHREAVLAQLQVHRAPRPSDLTQLSDDGAGGAVFLGTRLKDPQRVLAKGRGGPRQPPPGDLHSESSRIGSSSEDSDPADPPPIGRLSPARALDSAAFAVASPRRRAVRIEAVVKLERPALALETMRVHGVLDHIARTAPLGLPFDFGQHLVEVPDPSLLQRMKTAEAAPDRVSQLEQLQAVTAHETVAIRQEPIAGLPVNRLPFADRLALLGSPALCRRLASMLVIAPLVGLHDHLALDGCGNNNWSNLMLSPPDGLSVIDLAPSARASLDAGSLGTLESLVAGLERLARRTGRDGHLPADWRVDLIDTLRDFWLTTFSASGGLFSDDDFLPPALLQEQQRLREQDNRLSTVLHDLDAQRQAMAEDDAARPALDDLRRLAREGQATNRARLADIESTSIRQSNALLSDLRERALPHLVGGLIDGIHWANVNAEVLLQASAPAHGAAPAPDAAATRQALDILARLSLTARERLGRLNGVAPRPGERIHA